MAKVQFVDPSQEFVGRQGGTVFYRRNGSIVARQRVTPVYPQSAAQLAEISPIVAASKAWANTLTASQKAAYQNLPCVAGSGINALQAQWSWVVQGFPATPPITPFNCPLPVPSITAACWSSPPLSIPLLLDGGALTTADFGYLLGTGPMGLGVFPTPTQAKVLATGISLPSIYDAGLDFLAKWGGPPQPGQSILIGFRAIDSIGGGVTSIAWMTVPPCGGGNRFAWNPDPTVFCVSAGGAGFLTCDFASASSDAIVTFYETSGSIFFDSNTFQNGTTDAPVTFFNNSLDVGVHVLTFRFSNSENSETFDLQVTFDAQPC